MATKRIAKYFNVYDDVDVRSLESLVSLTSLLSGYDKTDLLDGLFDVTTEGVALGILFLLQQYDPQIQNLTGADRAAYLRHTFTAWRLELLPEIFFAELTMQPISYLIMPYVKTLSNKARVGKLPNFMHPVYCLATKQPLIFKTAKSRGRFDKTNWATASASFTNEGKQNKEKWETKRDLLLEAIKEAMAIIKDRQTNPETVKLETRIISLLLSARSIYLDYCFSIVEDEDLSRASSWFIPRLSLSPYYEPIEGGIPLRDDVLIDASSHPVFRDPVFDEVRGYRMSWFHVVGQPLSPVDDAGIPRDCGQYITLEHLQASVSNRQKLKRRTRRR
jgi:hypothetical protein